MKVTMKVTTNDRQDDAHWWISGVLPSPKVE
jgi:hypothetical protein